MFETHRTTRSPDDTLGHRSIEQVCLAELCRRVVSHDHESRTLLHVEKCSRSARRASRSECSKNAYQITLQQAGRRKEVGKMLGQCSKNGPGSIAGVITRRRPQDSTESGQPFTNLLPNRTNVGQLGPNVGQTWAQFGQNWPGSSPDWSKVGQIRSNLAAGAWNLLQKCSREHSSSIFRLFPQLLPSGLSVGESSGEDFSSICVAAPAARRALRDSLGRSGVDGGHVGTNLGHVGDDVPRWGHVACMPGRTRGLP